MYAKLYSHLRCRKTRWDGTENIDREKEYTQTKIAMNSQLTIRTNVYTIRNECWPK